jgi:23S rRNA pseudouridine1911/1915/1917 synthase
MELESRHVLCEDNHLLAVAKPAGLLVQGDGSGDPTLLAAARNYIGVKYAKPGHVYLGLVHRLDRPVSGVVLFARTSKAASRLSRQFRERSVRKVYLAVIEGSPAAATGELTAFLGQRADRQGVTRAANRPFTGAREARLVYTVLGTAGGRSLLRVEPQTGRRHQIRAQLALAGYPIVGDVKYGSRRRHADRSIALHARRLVVDHPVRDESVVLVAPIPTGWTWSDPLPNEE